MRMVVVLAMFLSVAACGAGGGGGGAGGGGGDPSECDYPLSQPVSSACCAAWGSDACGAGLFCAAFDGRKQTTCYLEGSRADRAACTADLHCQSGSCNQEKGACRSMQYTGCDPEIGCAPGTSNQPFVCTETENKCRPVGDGGIDGICGDDEDCNRGLSCVQSQCKVVSCITGDGKGPCAKDLESGACWDCMDDKQQDCWIESCQQDYERVSDCELDCFAKTQTREDENDCKLAECGPLKCAHQKCKARVCPELSACY